MFDHPVPYGFGLTVALPFDQALARTKEALIAHDFGVVSEIDLARTLRAKLGADMRPYVILGACVPSAASAALAVDPDVGLLLPCNVVVYATDDPYRTRVAALDPTRLFALTENRRLEALAADVAARLARALGALPVVPTPTELMTAADEIC